MISFPLPIWIEELKLSYEQSPKIQGIITALTKGEVIPRGYSLQHRLLLKKWKIVLIPASSFQKKMLHHIHTSPEAKHVGYHKTLQKAKLDFSWPRMRKDIKKAVKECSIYQISKSSNSLMLAYYNLYQFLKDLGKILLWIL